MSLEVLGLDQQAERVYRYCLRSGMVEFSSLCEASQLPWDSLDAVVRRLEDVGLLVRPEPGLVHALDPAVAVEKLINGELAELRERAQALEGVRGLIGPLCRDFQKPAEEDAADVQQIEGLANLRNRLDDLAFFARHEVMGLQPGGPWSSETIEAARPLDLRCLRRGIQIRTVVLQSALDDDLTRSYLVELVALGAQVRWSTGPLERIIIYDRVKAVAPLDPTDSRRGAVIVSQPGLVNSMVGLFERVWERSKPLELAGGDVGRAKLGEADRQVLAILCRVEKDEVGAREMEVSVRTFRRYVADLMARLGATSRFQVALLAKERGWI